MNKKAMIAIVVIGFLASAGAGLLFLNSKKNNENLPEETSSETIEKKSLKEFLGLSSNQECNFSDGATGNEGVVYVGSGKVRGDFQSKVGDKNSESHMIADGSTIYLWAEGQNQGIQLPQSSIENLGLNASEIVDVNKEIEYSCLPWAASDGVFVPPSKITFSDYSKMIPSSIPSGSSVQCASCASLPSEAKAQCEASLKCGQ